MSDSDGLGGDRLLSQWSGSSKCQAVWCRGDLCYAKYEEDSRYYKAKILSIRGERNHMYATVHFINYGSDEDTEVEINKLKKIPTQAKTPPRAEAGSSDNATTAESGLFSPLRGDEEEKRLSEKYAAYDNDDFILGSKPEPRRRSKVSEWRLLDDRSPCSGSSGGAMPRATQTRKQQLVNTPDTADSSRKKQVVATGGQRKAGRQTLRQRDTSKNSTKIDVDKNQQKNKYDDQDSQSNDGEKKLESFGFDDEDMEKPFFNHLSLGEKSPYVLSNDGEEPIIQIPAPINQYLRQYQREGIQFLYDHYKYNKGAILGDDMGLGKTVQVIGFLAAVLGKKGTREDVIRNKPRFIRMLSDSGCADENGKHKMFLIIAPGCVLYNWLDELDTWGHFVCGKYHGVDKEKTLRDMQREKVEIVVTTFETFRDNVEELNQFDWDAVFVDEVHKIKGLKTLVTTALKQIRTTKRYGLTGTALQNNLEEFWCILDWSNPGCLGSLSDFKTDYISKIAKSQKCDASKRELAEGRKCKEKLGQMKNKYMIRRTKDIIAEQLPSKDDQVVYCKLTKLQTEAYKAILKHDNMQHVLRQDDPCDCGSGVARQKCCYTEVNIDGHQVKVKGLTFAFMHLVAKVANHPALLLPNKNSSQEQQERAKEICKIAFRNHSHFVDMDKKAAFRTLSDPKYCGKMKVLQGMLQVFEKEKSKVLLFSYSTKLLDIIEQYVISKGMVYRRIDGQTSNKLRFEYTREFNKDAGIFVCLISTKAGGLGLNLIGANVVIIFDPNWNPTHDLQAQDRAYRIGQRRDVRVYRLIAQGTIEENMYLRQIYKQQLDAVAVSEQNARRYFMGIQGDKTEKGELFGVKNMFQLRTGDSCLTSDILQRNAKIEEGLGAIFDCYKYVSGSSQDDGSGTSDATASQGTTDTESSDIPKKQSLNARDETDQDGVGFICDQYVGTLSSDDEVAGDDDISQEGTLDDVRESPDTRPSTSKMKNYDRTSKLRQDRRVATLKRHTKYVADVSEFPSDDGDDDISQEGTFEDVRESPDTRPSASKMKNYDRTSKLRQDRRVATSKRHIKYGADASDFSSDETPEPVVKKSKGKGVGKRSKKAIIHSSSDEKEEQEFKSVSDVFEKYGVVHTHRNRQVVGPSKAENHMSKCAMQDVFELQQYSQEPAVNCEPIQELEEEIHKSRIQSQKRQRKNKKANTCTGPRVELVGNLKVLVGQTPKAIKRQHFKKLLEFHNELSEVVLAEKILNSSAEDRQEILQTFYASLYPELQGQGVQKVFPAIIPEDAAVTSKTKPPRGQRKTIQQRAKVKNTRKIKRTAQSKKQGCVFESDSDSECQNDNEHHDIEHQSLHDMKSKGRDQSRKRIKKNLSHPLDSDSDDVKNERGDTSSRDHKDQKGIHNATESFFKECFSEFQSPESMKKKDHSQNRTRTKTGCNFKRRQLHRPGAKDNVDAKVEEITESACVSRKEFELSPDKLRTKTAKSSFDVRTSMPKVSVLDDFFNESDDSDSKSDKNARKRKPPPKLVKRAKQDSIDDMLDFSSYRATQFKSESPKTTGDKKDVESHLQSSILDSDGEFDIFALDHKIKKTHHKQKCTESDGVKHSLSD